jgi:hypothetical protein
MGKRDVAKPLDRQNARHRFTHEWEHLSRSGVKEQRFIIHDEILVEGEAACTFDYNRRIDAIDPVSNLMYIRPGLPVRNGHQTSLPSVEWAAAFRCVPPNSRVERRAAMGVDDATALAARPLELKFGVTAPVPRGPCKSCEQESR